MRNLVIMFRKHQCIAFFLVLVASVDIITADEELTDVERKFPEDFRFGVSTSAYQIEGAWNVDGKSMSIWDHLARSNDDVLNGTNGDVAADSYNQYTRDIQMLKELGVKEYRFSISWTRILPGGFADTLNPAGALYYNKLIDEILKNNITPVVTLYHWDLPQRLQNFGGWVNPTIIEWFGDYAKVIFSLFGNRVKNWVTINQPRTVCFDGYGGANVAPVLNESGIADYLCSKNVLLAHAKAYRIYHDEFRDHQGGRVGISNAVVWGEPASDSPEDIQAAEDFMKFELDQFLHPIFSETGDYPQLMKDKILARSLEEGFPRSRLPTLNDKEVAKIRGTADFLVINHYTAKYVFRSEGLDNVTFRVPSFSHDLYVGTYQDDTWPNTTSEWQKSVSWGLYKALLYIGDSYNGTEIQIGENGVSTGPGLEDDDRVLYIREYLSAVLDAIEQGVHVVSYSHWSLMDSYEWIVGGYEHRYGLYEVDFESEDKTRTPRKSAFVYKDIIMSRSINMTYEPDPMQSILASIDESSEEEFEIEDSDEDDTPKDKPISGGSVLEFSAIFLLFNIGSWLL